MTPNTQPSFQEFFNGIITTLTNAFKNLTKDETLACGPAFVAFFTWLEANPTAPLNPIAIGPKLMILKLQLLSAQSTVASEEVQSVSKEFVTLFNTMITQAKG